MFPNRDEMMKIASEKRMIEPSGLSTIKEISKMITGATSNPFGNTNMSPSHTSPLKIEINGKLELVGQGGQSVDIMEMMRNNPLFVRQMTELIVEQITNNKFGGKSTLWPNRYSSV